MPSNVVRATLIADDRKFKSGFKSAEQSTTSFEKKISGTASLVSGFLAGAAASAVISFAKDSIRAFSELEQSTGSVESVFGDAADSIIANADDAANKFGLSASEFNSSAALIGAQLKNVLGLSADEAAGKVTDLIGKASDMAATFGGTTADAISAIGSLLRGERDPIERYGVSMNDAAIQAKALEMGLAKTNAELTPQMKSAAALEILYDQTADSAGQFAEEADTLAGKTQRLNAEMENHKAMVGEAIQGAYLAAYPAVSNLSSALADVAIRFMELTGHMDENTAALKRWELESGKSADTLTNIATAAAEANPEFSLGADLIDVFTGNQEKMNGVFREGISLMDLTTGSVRDHRNEIRLLTKEGVINEEQEKELLRVLDEEIVKQTNAARSAGQHRGKLDEVGTAADDTKGDVDELTAATQTYIDTLKAAVDPVFAAMDAVRNLKDEQAKLIEMQGDSSTSAAELAEQELKVAEALLEAQGSMDSLDPTTLNRAIETIATVLGKSKDEVMELLRQLGILDGKSVTTYIDTVHRTRYIDPRTGTARYGGPQAHSGGIVPGPPGAEVPILAKAGEVILPTHNIPGSGRAKAMMNGMGGTSIFITVNALDPTSAAKAVVQAIQTYERSNGTAWRK